MSTSIDDPIDVITEDEVDELINTTIDEIGIDLSTLRSYAERGRFDTERQRRAWFLISGLGRG